MNLPTPSGVTREVPDAICVERQVGAELGSVGGRAWECSSLSGEGYVVCEGYVEGGLAFNRLGGVAILQKEQKKQRHRDRKAWDTAREWFVIKGNEAHQWLCTWGRAERAHIGSGSWLWR